MCVVAFSFSVCVCVKNQVKTHTHIYNNSEHKKLNMGADRATRYIITFFENIIELVAHIYTYNDNIIRMILI